MPPKVKAGWGFSGKDDVILDTAQAVVKKQNIWEQNNEDIIIIPDMDQEKKDQILNQVSTAVNQPQVNVGKFDDLQKLTKSQTLPQAEEGVDLSILMQVISPVEEIQEVDQQWEFQKLKTEVYELVSNIYGQFNHDEEENY